MRQDAASILVWMGYRVDVDFIASSDGPGTANITWLSALAQPTPAEIDAAAQSAIDAQAAAAAEKAQSELDKADFKAKRQIILDDVAAILIDMQGYIDAPGTTNSARDAQLMLLSKAVKNIAKDLKILTNAVKGLL